MIALDTNLLVYAHRAGVPEHLAARRAIERACRIPGNAGIAAPCLAEFLGVATHPASVGGPSSPGEAAGFLSALIESGGVAVWVPGPGFDVRLLEAVRQFGVTGPRVFDLQIALIAVEHGAREIWTHDGSFATVPGLRRYDPIGRRKRGT